MKNLTTIGIDLAKNYIQLYGMDEMGNQVFKKRVKRDNLIRYMANLPTCLIGMEACGGANYWARRLIELGFEVKLMPPKKVKKYVDHHKNDVQDAKACAEAVNRGSMSFVPIRTGAQLEIQAIHRVRSHFVQQRTALMNMIRGLWLEHGIAIRKGKAALLKKLRLLDEEPLLSDQAKALFEPLRDNLKALDEQIQGYDEQLTALSEENTLCQKLKTIDGIGPITSTALVAKIGNGSAFKNGRELSAYLGLVPKQASSGDKQVLLGITKHGDRYVRKLLIHGGRSVVQSVMRMNRSKGEFMKQDVHSQWIRSLVERVGRYKSYVAVANKNARMVIALLKDQMQFDPRLAH